MPSITRVKASTVLSQVAVLRTVVLIALLAGCEASHTPLTTEEAGRLTLNAKVDGVPFKNIDIGDTFLYNGDCYVKIIWKKDKYNIAMNLDILECREFEDYDVVNATWNIVESLQYKSNQVKEWFKEKVDISNENIGM